MGFGDETGHYPTHFIGDDGHKYPCESVEKIESDILELIELGDILKLVYGCDGRIFYFGIEDEMDDYDDVKDSILKGEIKLLQIIPGNLIKEEGYVIGG